MARVQITVLVVRYCTSEVPAVNQVFIPPNSSQTIMVRRFKWCIALNLPQSLSSVDRSKPTCCNRIAIYCAVTPLTLTSRVSERLVCKLRQLVCIMDCSLHAFVILSAYSFSLIKWSPCPQLTYHGIPIPPGNEILAKVLDNLLK